LYNCYDKLSISQAVNDVKDHFPLVAILPDKIKIKEEA